jgi:mannose-6-phosphate isomerase-like protein (cupin superfamily)
MSVLIPIVYDLTRHFAQLTSDDGCLPIEVGPSFWEKGVDALPPGRLVSLIESDSDWASWERHPNGEELIIQLSGELALLLEIDGANVERRLRTGEFLIVPSAVWHTADVISPGQALFITPGTGTEGRPRVL